ncbi:uncharacterized protein [Nicotiana tomentosiformis]|uniref:uncharacterized protein n=1 Tax=Nicotiana tomentosiformis TaxID=4098 RepID=UPI00388C4414
MDFVVGLPQTQKKFDAIWVIVDRLTKSAHFIPVGTTYSAEQLAEIYIREISMLNGVLDRLCVAQSRQKSYADWKVRDVEFMVRERVLLWVSPLKGIMRFGKKGKLIPRYIRSFEILERISEVAYKLALPPILAAVHLVFHVSMLRKYHGDLSHVLDFSSVQLDKDSSYVEDLVAILDRQVRKLRSKNIISVKVQWRE